MKKKINLTDYYCENIGIKQYFSRISRGKEWKKGADVKAFSCGETKLRILSKGFVISKQAWTRKIDLPEPTGNVIIRLGVS